jgi:hypothetical protein
MGSIAMNPVNFDPCAAGCQRAARTRVKVPAHLPQEPWMCRWCERSTLVDHLIAQLSTSNRHFTLLWGLLANTAFAQQQRPMPAPLCRRWLAAAPMDPSMA